MSVLREMLLGTAAGAAGTLAERAGVDLGSDETEQNRKSGLGALSGYVVGLGVGTAYGLIRPHLGGVPKTRASVALGVAAMAGSDVPAAALGVTNPAEWGANSWLSDIVPHLAYGLTTALAYDFPADV
jgi:hypothetical protein